MPEHDFSEPSTSSFILEWGLCEFAQPPTTFSNLRISDLHGAFSPRAKGLDPAHVRVLLQCPEPLPPIVVHKSSLRVIDGLHRLRVAKIRNEDQVKVAFFDGADEEAFALSVLLNVRHGLPLALEERKHAAVKMLSSNPGWSDRFVARLAGLSPGTVARMRQRSTARNVQSNPRLGQDGRVRPIDPAEGRLRAAKLLAERPQLTLRELARAAQISVSTARDVRIRLLNGDDPVRRRPRGACGGMAGNTGGYVEPESPNGQALPLPMAQQSAIRRDQKARGSAARTSDDIRSFNVILERLRKDPAIRFNEAGRNLIRQLTTARQIVMSCQEALRITPAHCLSAVAELARTNATDWQQLAELAGNVADMKEAL